MKKYICLVLTILFGLNLLAQSSMNPMSYPYYIRGVTSIDPHDGTVMLKDISYKGVSCKQESIKFGFERNEKAVFVFEEIKTNPEISLAGKTLQYWRQDESGAWMTDAEGGNGVMDNTITKDINVMLVLDCSASLGQDFIKVKRGAVTFVNKLLQASSGGNVKLGIIGFSSMPDSRVYGPVALTQETYISVTNFIYSLSVGSVTSLYYAIDKAVDLLDLGGITNSANFDGAYMLVFTDGIDTGTRFNERMLFKEPDAYDYVKNRLRTKRIDTRPIESYIIGAKGDDLRTEDQILKFKNRLEGFVDPNHLERFVYLDKMTNLENTFSSIADGLVQRWQTLYCNSAINHEGGVCWTYGKLPKPSFVPSNWILGVNLGVEVGKYSYLYSYPEYSEYYEDYVENVENVEKVRVLPVLGLDIAIPFSKSFALGLYSRFGPYSMSLGLLTAWGNFWDKGKMLLVGAGMTVNEYDHVMINLSIGKQYRSGIYVIGELYGGVDYGASVRIGYNLGRFINGRRRN